VPIVSGENQEIVPVLLALVSLVIVAAGAAAFWLGVRRTRETGGAPQKARPAARFGAVEIRTRGNACAAARSLEGQRFLARRAPALPLPDCAAPQCTCSFGKLSDRRTEGRRLEHGGSSAALFLRDDRREKPDRRADPPH
jgi:hypothetical protein